MDLGQECGGVGATPCSDPEDSSQSWPELAGFKSIGNFGRLVGGTYISELAKRITQISKGTLLLGKRQNAQPVGKSFTLTKMGILEVCVFVSYLQEF